jgi:alpha-ketoglutarate-dependent taurine dioxygenase
LHWLSIDLPYRHHWSPGRLIVRDNRSLLHCATSCDPNARRRVIRRCTVLG